MGYLAEILSVHDDVIKWKHFPRYWSFVWGIHRSPVNSPHKGQWRGALMFSLICARINGWVNNREAVDLRRHQAHCDVIVMGWAGVGGFEDAYGNFSSGKISSRENIQTYLVPFVFDSCQYVFSKKRFPMLWCGVSSASIHKAVRRLSARSREDSRPRDSGLDFSNRFEIWQAPRRKSCKDACQFTERYGLYNIQYRSFEASRDLAVRRLTA